MVLNDTHKAYCVFLEATSKNFVNRLVEAKKILALAKPQIKAVFEVLAKEDACPFVIYGPFTWLIVGLVLTFLGVDKADILIDFTRTEQYADALLEELNVRRRKHGLEDVLDIDLSPSYIHGLIEHMDTEYQGIEVYLASTGLTHHQLQAVEDNLRGVGRVHEKLVDVDQYSIL